MSVPALFEAVDVRREFRSGSGARVRALDGVSFAVPKGAFFALTGPSGCGKTTLLALLAALDRPTGGSVRFDGRDTGRLSEWERARIRRRLGIVFQHTPMIGGLPLWENVTCALVPGGAGPAERRRLAAELLLRVGVGGRDGARPEELSGGERRRVGIARALASRPDAIVADEPTADLDRASADAIAALLGGLHAAGTTVVVATHDPVLAALATGRCRLEHGRVAAC